MSRLRFRIRTLMIAVAAVALVSVALRQEQDLGTFLGLGLAVLLLEAVSSPRAVEPATGRLTAGSEAVIADHGGDVAVEAARDGDVGGLVASGTLVRVISDWERPAGKLGDDRPVLVELLEGEARGQGRRVERSRLRPVAEQAAPA
jgi:hypothetical protein